VPCATQEPGSDLQPGLLYGMKHLCHLQHYQNLFPGTCHLNCPFFRLTPPASSVPPSASLTYLPDPAHRSPEVIAARPYTYASDLWSLGCVLYEMAARRPAFEALGLPQLMVNRPLYSQRC
jgi:serine/threonine protein kinase